MNAAPPFFANPVLAVAQPGRAVCAVVIDTEEGFDWDRPVLGTSGSTANIANLNQLQSILGAYGIVPTCLLTYPVMEDAAAVRILNAQLERGQCVLGLQLHPWVTPPFDGTPSVRTSFAGNLQEQLEEQKILSMKRKFMACFGHSPTIYRAGRYGLSRGTAAMLEKHGIVIDTSVAPRTSFASEGGPDYEAYDYQLFWFGEHRRLLEVPLCRSVVGWTGRWAPMLYRASVGQNSLRHFPSILARSQIAERITLSPEGNDELAIRRLIRAVERGGQRILSLSFHSSSLQAGQNPYVRSKADLHTFYDRLSATLTYLAGRTSFASLDQIPTFLVESRSSK